MCQPSDCRANPVMAITDTPQRSEFILKTISTIVSLQFHVSTCFIAQFAHFCLELMKKMGIGWDIQAFVIS